MVLGIPIHRLSVVLEFGAVCFGFNQKQSFTVVDISCARDIPIRSVGALPYCQPPIRDCSSMLARKKVERLTQWIFAFAPTWSLWTLLEVMRVHPSDSLRFALFGTLGMYCPGLAALGVQRFILKEVLDSSTLFTQSKRQLLTDSQNWSKSRNLTIREQREM
jgi:hypothetical protein